MKKLDRFIDKYYTDTLNKLIGEIKNKVTEKEDEIILSLNKQFKDCLNQIINIQQKNIKVKVKYINISFLLTSIYEDEIRLKVEAYPSGGNIMSEPIYEGEIKLKHYKAIIDNTKNKLMKYIDDEMYSSFIHESHIDQMILRMVLVSHIYFSEYYKYFTKEIFEVTEIKLLDKENDFFITYGEYFDWQKAIYGKRDIIDIFNKSEDDDLNFREFISCIYEDKEFDNLSLKNCIFDNCRFEDVLIRKTIFEDCTFENCIFENVDIVDSTVIGNTFDNCKMYNTNFKNTSLHNEESMSGNNFKLYKGTEFIDSSIIKCEFTNTNLRNSVIEDTTVLECNFTNVDTQSSDFSLYIKEEE